MFVWTLAELSTLEVPSVNRQWMCCGKRVVVVVVGGFLTANDEVHQSVLSKMTSTAFSLCNAIKVFIVIRWFEEFI